MNNIRFITLISTFLLIGGMHAQSCTGFHKKNCKSGAADGWIYNSQSKSGLFEEGMSSEIKIVIFKDFDYALTLCCEKSLGRGDLSLTMKDAKTGELIYDNSTDNLQQHIEFSAQTTRNVIITVTAGGGGGSSEPKNDKGSDNKKTAQKTTTSKSAEGADGGCVGLLIEQKASSKQGF